MDHLTASLYVTELNRIVLKHTGKELFSKEVIDFDFSNTNLDKISAALLRAEDPLSFKGMPFCAIFDGALYGNKECTGCPVAKHDFHCLDSKSLIFRAKWNSELSKNYSELTRELQKFQKFIKEEEND